MKFPYRGKPITPNELLELISPLTNVPTVVEALNLLLKEVRGKFGDQDVSFPRCVMAAAMVRHNIDASATSDSDLEQIKNAVSILHQRFGPICDEVVAAMLLHGVMVYPRRKAEGIDICKKALAALNKEGALTRCKLAKVLPFATVEFNASVLETRVPMASEIVTHTLSDLVNRPIGNQEKGLIATALGHLTVALSFRRLQRMSKQTDLYMTLLNLGEVLMVQDHFERAERYLREAHEIFMALTNQNVAVPAGDPSASQLLVTVLNRLGRLQEAAIIILESEKMSRIIAARSGSPLHTLALLQVWRLRDYNEAMNTADHMLKAQNRDTQSRRTEFETRYWYMVASRAAAPAK